VKSNYAEKVCTTITKSILQVQDSKVQGSEVQGFRGSRIQRFKDSEVQGFSVADCEF
jgi:hypothetical protein